MHISVKDTLWDMTKEAEMLKKAKESGHDGLAIHKGDGVIDYVGTDPSQVKHAISNSGEFDRSSDSILKALLPLILSGSLGENISP